MKTADSRHFRLPIFPVPKLRHGWPTATVLCACLALLTTWPAHAAESQPQIRVVLDREKIYEGESVIYSVVVDNVENPVPPELEGFDDFQIETLAVAVRDSRRVDIINGQRTESVRRRRVYNYRLTPRRSGTLRVPAPTVDADGQILHGKELSLEVTVPIEQDIAKVSVSVDPPEVYPTQPFTITVSVSVKGFPAPYSRQSPVSIQGTSRNLQIPWVLERNLPAGLRSLVDAERWLDPLISSKGDGFGINLLGTLDSFDLRRRQVRFLPETRRSPGTDASGDPVEYWEYRFARRYVADRVAEFRFGAVTLKGSFAESVTDDGRPNVVSIFAMAKPLTVTVKDVPTAGRPASYSGAIGNEFRLRAELAPPVAKVGDPMDLTLTLTGNGTLEQTSAPDLERFPEIAQRFSVQKTAEETRDGARRFTYTVRPRKAGIEQWPAVPLSFFHVEEDRFETVHSEPIPVKVSQPRRMDDTQIVAGSRSAAGKGLEIQEGGIFANIDDPGAVRDQTVRPGRWLAGLGSMAGAYCILVLVVRGVQRRMEDPALLRRRKAAAQARRRLQTATEELQAGRLRQGADQVRAAMVGLVADVADLPEVGLTPREVERQLVAMGAGESLIGRLHALWEKCDAAQFGASAGALDRLGRQAAELIDAMIEELKALKRFR